MIQVKRFVLGMLQTNCYLVINEELAQCVLIDAAYDCSKVIEYVRKNSLCLSGVLLTHGHFDHCGGVKQITDALGETKVFCQRQDCYMASCAAENEWGIDCYDCAVTDTIATEGKITLAGLSFDCFFTPGHSAGSVCYVLNEYLFCGDTLFEGSIGRTDLPTSNGMDMMQSLKRLKSLTFDYVCCCGHGAQTTLFAEKQSNPYMQL